MRFPSNFGHLLCPRPVRVLILHESLVFQFADRTCKRLDPTHENRLLFDVFAKDVDALSLRSASFPSSSVTDFRFCL